MLEQSPQRRIRSFVLRTGRITDAQQRALTELWPRFGIDLPSDAAELPLPLDEFFGRSAPKVLEIGFGNGDNLVEYAARDRQRNFIGVEVHRAGVGHALLRALDLQLDNLRLICHDVVEVLERGISSASLDEVLILFPDPWHKKRHHKRRLVQAPFIELLADRIRPGGLLQLATDWQPYAEQMLEVIGNNRHFVNRSANLGGSEGFVPRPDWRALTRFERRGQRLGHGVWDLSFERLHD